LRIHIAQNDISISNGWLRPALVIAHRPWSGSGTVRADLQGAASVNPHQRATARTHLWGEVKDAAGNAATATLDTPEAYAFTAASAVESVERTVAGKVPPGAWTPSRAFGAGYIEELPGVVAGEVRHIQA